MEANMKIEKSCIKDSIEKAKEIEFAKQKEPADISKELDDEDNAIDSLTEKLNSFQKKLAGYREEFENKKSYRRKCDFERVINALEIIRETCSEYDRDCNICPLSTSDEGISLCRIRAGCPADWEIVEKCELFK